MKNNFPDRKYINIPSRELLDFCHKKMNIYTENRDKTIFDQEYFDKLKEFIYRSLKSDYGEYDLQKLEDWTNSIIYDNFCIYYFKNAPKIENLQAYLRRLIWGNMQRLIKLKYKKNNSVDLGVDLDIVDYNQKQKNGDDNFDQFDEIMNQVSISSIEDIVYQFDDYIFIDGIDYSPLVYYMIISENINLIDFFNIEEQKKYKLKIVCLKIIKDLFA